MNLPQKPGGEQKLGLTPHEIQFALHPLRDSAAWGLGPCPLPPWPVPLRQVACRSPKHPSFPQKNPPNRIPIGQPMSNPLCYPVRQYDNDTRRISPNTRRFPRPRWHRLTPFCLTKSSPSPRLSASSQPGNLHPPVKSGLPGRSFGEGRTNPDKTGQFQPDFTISSHVACFHTTTPLPPHT